jgi:hypothetical protein
MKSKIFALLILLVLALPTIAQETEPVIPVINAQSVIPAPVELRSFQREGGFATALAHEGDVLAVGAPLEMVAVENGVRYGAVYIYRSVGEQWVLEQKLINPTEYHNFGTFVVIENGQLAISVWGTGIYFYTFNGTSWEISNSLLDADTNENDGFGAYLTWKNDLMAFGDNHLQVRVFRLVLGTWIPEATLEGEPTIPFGNLRYGASMDFSDDGLVLAVGEADAWMFGNTNPKGATYIYSYNGVTWVLEKKLEELESPGAFGFAVDLIGAGNNIILAASDTGIYNDEPFLDSSGIVYLYSRSAGLWTKTQQFMADSDVTFDSFGTALAFVGSPENAALIVTSVPNRHPSEPLAPARFYIYDVQSGTQLGEVISPSETDFDDDGQLDSDGFGRIISLDGVGASLPIVVAAPGRVQQVFVFSHNPNPQEMADAGDFETNGRDLILNSWNTSPGVKLKCGRGVNASCGVKFVSGIPSKITQNVDLSQFPLLPGDGLLFQMDAKVKGAAVIKAKLKVIYADGFSVVMPLRVENTGGVYRTVMTAPAIFIANRPLDRIVISIKHTWQGGAAFLDNVSLVRVAGSAAR